MAPDGDLSSFDSEDIAIGAGWKGDAEEFVEACLRRGLLDQTEHGLSVHDWEHYHGSIKAAARAKRYAL